jgi:hypothetical protein
MNGPRATFGFPEEWDAFIERHPGFPLVLEHLKKALEIAFIREFTTAEPLDRVVFQLGNVCRQDFFEILLLAGNGYGLGALKLLRGMFERAITARYLASHPAMIDAYFRDGAREKKKLMDEILATVGPTALTAAQIQRARADFDALVNANPGDAGDRMPDFVSRGRALPADGSIWKLRAFGYYRPLFQTHASVHSIIARLENTDRGIAFDGGTHRDEADSALMTAHNVLLDVLALQGTHFHLADLPMDECVRDWMSTWGETKGTE